MTKVLYTGSFDPITKGHMSIIDQASSLFEEVVVAVLQNSKKNPLFTIEERVKLIKTLYNKYNNIKVVSGTGAAVDIALLHECNIILRGLRSLTDFDYEIGLANINKQISNNKINTLCLFADPNYQYISSSVVKEVFNLDKDIDLYVDPIVKDAMVKKKVKRINENGH